MKKFDAGSAMEKKISRMVFYAYLDTDNIIEFNKKITELSNETKLDEGYLKRLRCAYYDTFASDVERHKHDDKKAYYSGKTPEYILVCDEVFEVPENERVKYMYSMGIKSNSVKEYLAKYKKNGKYKNLVDDFYDQYMSFIKSINKSVAEDRNDDCFYEACSFYESLIDLGFYNIQDYIQYVIDDSKDFRKVEAKCISYRKNINKFNPELMDQYVIDMEKNREKTYYFMKERIDYFMKRVRNTSTGLDNVDIIDYYMNIGIPLHNFKKLCKNFENIAVFNSIFEPYYKMEQGVLDNPKIACNYVFNGRVASFEDKMNVLNFLYQNNIPYVYFNIALKKYFDGGLDQYINSDVKKKTLSSK